MVYYALNRNVRGLFYMIFNTTEHINGCHIAQVTKIRKVIEKVDDQVSYM